VPEPSDNLELVRRIFRDWERGEYGSSDWADPEIEFLIDTGLDPQRATGIEAMAEAWGAFLDTWEGWRVRVEEFMVLDQGRVLVLLEPAGRAQGSGLEIGQIHTKGANVFHIRDGKVKKLHLYLDRKRALADLGLTESDLSGGEGEVP
jgi:ketosteroid isomerase-like protein